MHEPMHREVWLTQTAKEKDEEKGGRETKEELEVKQASVFANVQQENEAPPPLVGGG